MSTEETVLLVGFDFETTGLSCYTTEPIEIGSTAWRWNRMTKTLTPAVTSLPSTSSSSSSCSSTHEFSKRVFTKKILIPKIVELTGIRQEDVKKADPFPTVWTQWTTWLKQLRRHKDEPIVLLGHHCNRFDLMILVFTLERCRLLSGSEEKDWRESAIQYFQDLGVMAYFDIYPWSQTNLTQLSNRKLGTIYQHVVGRPLEHAHSALADARAVVDIVRHARALHNMDWQRDALPLNAAIDSFYERRSLWRQRKQVQVQPLSHESKRSTSGQKRSLEGTPSPSPPMSKRARYEASPAPLPLVLTEPRVVQQEIQESEIMCRACRIVYSSYFGHACLV